MTLQIFAPLPHMLNVNGDVDNARVLKSRAQWLGCPAEVVHEHPSHPDLVVLGSGFDADLVEMAEALRSLATALSRWVADEVPILAVGTSFELLSENVELAPGEEIRGLGILPGRSVAGSIHVSGDLVVDSPWGTLVGFENRRRDFDEVEGATPLGTVMYGRGNGRSGLEGIVHGSVIATHLHGPVLARNPALADHMLRFAVGDVFATATNTDIARADELAAKAREGTLRDLSLQRQPRRTKEGSRRRWI